MGVQIGILTSDISLIKKTVEILTNLYEKNKKKLKKITVINLKSAERAYDFINFEFPDYMIINYNDPIIDSQAVLQTINKDPWLHSTGIIVLMTREQIESIPDFFQKLNILSFMD